MKKLAFFLLTASLITACSSDDLSQDVTPAHAVNQLASSSVSVSNEGYLVFPTIQSLQNLWSNVQKIIRKPPHTTKFYLTQEQQVGAF